MHRHATKQSAQDYEIQQHLVWMAEEQVLFLKQRYNMLPVDIIHLYGGQTTGEESYADAVERIALFNWHHAASNGFVVS